MQHGTWARSACPEKRMRQGKDTDWLLLRFCCLFFLYFHYLIILNCLSWTFSFLGHMLRIIKKKHSPSPPPVFFLFVKNFKRFSRVRKAMILFIPLSCMLFLVQKLSITMGLSKSVSKFIKKSIFPVSKSEVKPMAASSAEHSTLLGTGCLLQLGKAWECTRYLAPTALGYNMGILQESFKGLNSVDWLGKHTYCLHNGTYSFGKVS